MRKLDIKEASKENYTVAVQDNQAMSNELITMGAIQRIADATELMAGNYSKLQNDLEMYKRWYNDERESNKRLYRSNTSLRGHLTRLRKLAKAKQQAINNLTLGDKN